MSPKLKTTDVADGATISRRGVAAAFGGVLLSGCAAAGNRSPFFSTLLNFNRPAIAPIDRKKIDSIPYASILAWFDGSAKALLVLGEYQADNRLVWYSAEHQSVTTWGPFVTKVLGTEVSLLGTSLSGGWDTDLRKMFGQHLGRSADFQAPANRVTLTSRSKFIAAGKEDITIADVDRRGLLKIKESVVADKTHHFTNEYWIQEDNGFCWKSRQLVIPTMPLFNIEIAKAPRGAAKVEAA